MQEKMSSSHQTKFLFSEEGLADLRKFAALNPLLGFDFDGTLAAIQLDPDSVAVSNETWALLERLHDLYCIAIVSGREKADVRGRLPALLPYIIGNHGIEVDSTETPQNLIAASDIVSQWVLQLAKILSAAPHRFDVENKTFSLCVHFSKATSPIEAEKYLLSEVKKLVPKVHVLRGKNVVNLLPPGMPHKGDALKATMEAEKKTCAIFIGDDVTDEDVFENADENIFSIKVGKEKTAARYFINDQKDIEKFMEILVGIGRERK